IANEDNLKLASLRKATWTLFFILGGITAILLTLFRKYVSQLMLGGSEYSNSVVFLSIALLFTMSATIQNSILNAYHRVNALAKVGAIDAILGSGISITLIWLFGFKGIIPMIIGGAVTSWIVSRFYLWRNVKPVPASPSKKDVFEAAKSLLSFGAPYTMSILVGTGVQMVLPIIVLHTLGAENVGYYRAAVSITTGYMSFLIATFDKDYFPRLSAAVGRPETLIRLVNEQHQVVMLLSIPLILTVFSLIPYLVPLLFSAEFYPAAEVLEWQLIGCIFKFSSWTISYVILVRCRSSIYFFTELVAGVTTLFSSWLGIWWFGLAGLGIGFLATYVIYYLVVWIIVRRDIRLVWTSANKKMILSSVVCALILSVLPWTILRNYRTSVALLFAMVMSLRNLQTILREIRKVRSGEV
ncbi:MAG: oligosaccharide flippase family protein, partial [Candidatus Bathyarchaeia archaeon]